MAHDPRPVRGGPPRSLPSDRRGAVYVETLIAFLPVFFFFSGLVQLSMLYAADVVTKHAAWMAARSAVVVIPDDPQYYGGGGQGLSFNTGNVLACGQSSGTTNLSPNGEMLSDIEQAAKGILTAVDPAPRFSLTFPSGPGGGDDRTAFGLEDMVYVQVHYSYPCRIPVGNLIVCGPSETMALVGESAMPMQGANYTYAAGGI